MRRIFRSQDRHGQSGAVAVEFAVVLPFLLILIGGIVFFGFALYQWTMLYAGARAGADYARVHLYDSKGLFNSTGIANVAKAAVPFGTPSVTVNGPACYCVDDSATSDGTCAGTCNINNGGVVNDTRVLKYVQIVVSEPTWGTGHFVLPAKISGYATARYQ